MASAMQRSSVARPTIPGMHPRGKPVPGGTFQWDVCWFLPKKPNLVGGLDHFLFFHSVGNFIIPTDELHDFSEGFKPPTSNSSPREMFSSPQQTEKITWKLSLGVSGEPQVGKTGQLAKDVNFTFFTGILVAFYGQGAYVF